MSRKPNLVFMGTPDFAVPTLLALAESNQFNIAAVVTQSDNKSGRGMKLSPTPVKKAAQSLNLKVFQPKSIKDIELSSKGALTSKKNTELVEHINSFEKIDAYIVVAYGKIIPRSLMDHARRGVLNIHASLLPRWRGAAPLQYSIFSGDTQTGVSIMQIEEGLDTGPVFCMESIEIKDSDTLGSIHNKLSELGKDTLLKVLPSIISGELTAIKQDDSKANHAPKWESKDRTLDWTEPAEVCWRRIRACNPFPGARTYLNSEQVKILDAEPGHSSTGKPSGTIISQDSSGILVAAGNKSTLVLKSMQFPGKKLLPVSEILKGNKISLGDKFKNLDNE